MNGKELKKFRADNNITLAEFERLSGVSRSALSRFELYNATITTETAEAIKTGIINYLVEKALELYKHQTFSLENRHIRKMFEFHKFVFDSIGFDLMYSDNSFYIMIEDRKLEFDVEALYELYKETLEFYLNKLNTLVEKQINTIEDYLKVAENEE